MSVWKTLGYMAGGVGVVAALPVLGAVGAVSGVGAVVGVTGGLIAKKIFDNDDNDSSLEQLNANLLKQLEKYIATAKLGSHVDQLILALGTIGVVTANAENGISQSEYKEIDKFIKKIDNGNYPISLVKCMRGFLKNPPPIEIAVKLAQNVPDCDKVIFSNMIKLIGNADNKFSETEQQLIITFNSLFKNKNLQINDDMLKGENKQNLEEFQKSLIATLKQEQDIQDLKNNLNNIAIELENTAAMGTEMLERNNTLDINSALKNLQFLEIKQRAFDDFYKHFYDFDEKASDAEKKDLLLNLIIVQTTAANFDKNISAENKEEMKLYIEGIIDEIFPSEYYTKDMKNKLEYYWVNPLNFEKAFESAKKINCDPLLFRNAIIIMGMLNDNFINLDEDILYVWDNLQG